MVWSFPGPHQEIPVYINRLLLTWYHEGTQALGPKELDSVVHHSPARSSTFVRDVLSEKKELVEIQESDPDSRN